MRIFIEFLCRFVFRELVAWKEVHEFVLELKEREPGRFTEKELWKIRFVGYFSGFMHHGQTRADGSKYITHPIAVAKVIIFDLKIFDLNMILAAILHDNAEDSGWPWGLVFFLIEILTCELVSLWVFFLSKHVFLQAYFETIQFLRELCIILIKLADRIHNLRTLEFMPLEKQRRKLLETMTHFPVFLDIIQKDISLEKNAALRQSIDELPRFTSRCEEVFVEAYMEAVEKYTLQKNSGV